MMGARQSEEGDAGAARDEGKYVVGTAKPTVVRALEQSRREQPSAEGDEMLEKLRAVERRLGLHAEEAGLATTIKRIRREAYVVVDIKTRKVEVMQDEAAPAGEASNAARRAANVVAINGPARKKSKREAQVVAVIFKRQNYTGAKV
eukprot:7105021-Prymnesium_polylepis.2